MCSKQIYGLSTYNEIVSQSFFHLCFRDRSELFIQNEGDAEHLIMLVLEIQDGRFLSRKRGKRWTSSGLKSCERWKKGFENQ